MYKLGWSYVFPIWLAVLISLHKNGVSSEFHNDYDDDEELDMEFFPTVTIVLLARNKAHTLPHSLYYLEQLDYPKSRMSLYIRSDHNQDETGKILRSWTDSVKDDYHSIDMVIQDVPKVFDKTVGVMAWPDHRFVHLMRLKEEGLEAARHMWADYVWFLDADVFITNAFTLQNMIKYGFTVTAPMLKSVGLYSNFWAGMNENYYYNRTENYLPILERKDLGCHEVPMVHSSFLVNLKRVESQYLTFIPSKVSNYDAAHDDLIVFALSAKFNGVHLHVCNNFPYGYVMLPLTEEQDLTEDFPNLSNLKLQMIADGAEIGHVEELAKHLPQLPQKNNLGVDNVYMINLERRPERRVKMEACFDEIGIRFQWLPAVDGKKMTEQYLDENGIKMMPDFSEPYHGRALTYGEIGCFMSHYTIWKDIVDNGYDQVIVLEDDIRFEPFFKHKLGALQDELADLALEWDLVFLGRKIISNEKEDWIDSSSQLVDVGYTYWTLAYMLTKRGAEKLLAEKPLGKMVPVDEYLPIMYDRHPNEEWKAHFQNRNLKAFSVHPLLVHPTHYTGEMGYISDTEETPVIATEKDNSNINDEL